jgi:hypothetical protein
MKSDADKVTLLGRVEGRPEIREVLCDLFYLKDGRPVAILDWGVGSELTDGQYAHLRPELLRPSTTPGIRFHYQNESEPILIPKGLANQPPAPLTEAEFRRGFSLREVYIGGECDPLNRFPASLLDQDGQPVSTGLAYLESDSLIGGFWPQEPSSPDKIPFEAARFLGWSAGRVEIFDCCRCHSGSPHFHFSWRK